MLQVQQMLHLITVPSYLLQICRRIKMIHLLGGHTWGRCDALVVVVIWRNFASQIP